MEKYILALDQGTTGSTVVLVNKKGLIISKETQEFPQLFPYPGFVEHNPEDIWNSVNKALEKCLLNSKIKASQIHSIGITNQRETTLLWDKSTGQALHNAIVWQCRRTTDLCKELKNKGLEDLYHKKTGLYLDPYFSGTKISYLLDKVKPKISKTYCGTIDTYLLFRLTNKKVFLTEPSNASRTLLFNINEGCWDPQLLKPLNIPEEILPAVKNSAHSFGFTENHPFLPDGIPITGILGDQQAALFGNQCFSRGDAKCTYGTGAFLLLNTGKQPVFSENKLLSTIAWQINEEITYALEGAVFIAGAAIQWLRDGLKIISSAPEVNKLANLVDSSDELFFVPALTGLGAPYWDPNARGIIFGITRGTTSAHLARASLEGIAFQVCDLINSMEKDLEAKIHSLKVDGGASASDLLMQIQADLLQGTILRPKQLETTALGAAYISGLTSAFWKNRNELSSQLDSNKEYSPKLGKEYSSKRIAMWREAVSRCLSKQL